MDPQGAQTSSPADLKPVFIGENYFNLGTTTNVTSNSVIQSVLNSPPLFPPFKFGCKICLATFQDENEVEIHYKSRRIADRKYRCCACQKTFRDNSQLSVHGRRHTGEQPFECKECGKKFSINGNLTKHMRIHKGEKRFECAICKKKFMQHAHLQDHMETHAGGSQHINQIKRCCFNKLFIGERPHTCSLCDCSFKTQARLTKHLKRHEDDHQTRKKKRYVQCPICMESIRKGQPFTLHLEKEHKDQNTFSCTECQESFKNVADLQSHYRTQHSNTRFICTFCNKMFTCSSYFRRHQNTHKGNYAGL